MSLAGLYEELLQDRVTAVELLRKAWRIDPTSRETEEAFRMRGFRKLKDEWVEIRPRRRGRLRVRQPKALPLAGTTSQGLLGLTPDEVRAEDERPAVSRELLPSQGPTHRAVDLSS